VMIEKTLAKRIVQYSLSLELAGCMLLAALVMLSCSIEPRQNDSGANDFYGTISAPVDSNGGALNLHNATGDLTTLEIPPAALSTPTTITLSGIDKAPSAPIASCFFPGVILGPPGLLLEKPVKLIVSLASPGLPEQKDGPTAPPAGQLEDGAELRQLGIATNEIAIFQSHGMLTVHSGAPRGRSSRILCERRRACKGRVSEARTCFTIMKKVTGVCPPLWSILAIVFEHLRLRIKVVKSAWTPEESRRKG
jgi:hypothetical protein